MDEKEKFIKLFEEVVNMVTLKVITITTPQDWMTTRDIMLTEINVPKKVQDLLKDISEISLESLEGLTNLGLDPIIIERMVFNILIRKGMYAISSEIKYRPFLKYLEKMRS